MGDLLSNVLGYFLQGLKDCFYGLYAVYKIDASIPQKQQPTQQGVLAQRRAAAAAAAGKPITPTPKRPPSARHTILSRIIRCSITNGGIILSQVVLFRFILIPILQYLLYFILQDEMLYTSMWSWLDALLTTILGVFWIYPLWLITRFTNIIWFQDIADSAWRYQGKKRKPLDVSIMLSDLLYNSIAQLTFMLQGHVLQNTPIPYVGNFLGVLHVSLITSLYAFEYRWIEEGVSFAERIGKIERQWPYFLGFALPVTLLTSLTDLMWLNSCLFAVVFPFLIVSAHEATEIRKNFDFPLPLFNVVIKISDVIVNSLIAVISRPKKGGAKLPQPTPKS